MAGRPVRKMWRDPSLRVIIAPRAAVEQWGDDGKTSQVAHCQERNCSELIT